MTGSLFYSLYISLTLSAAMRVDAAHAECSQYNDSPLLTQTQANNYSFNRLPVSIIQPWIQCPVTGASIIAHPGSHRGDQRSTRSPLSFVTMPMVVSVSMVTCPLNTLTHQCCSHESKLYSLVSQELWTAPEQKWVIDILNTFWSISIWPDMSDCTLSSIEEHGISSFPDDAKDMSVHHSVSLWKSVCNSRHRSLFPSSGQRRLIKLPRTESCVDTQRQHMVCLYDTFYSLFTWFNN